ncbi:integral membrane protein 2Bb isoform X1 [Dunckerocampus dactyliophorus]|uniref:integral membrane protein 2Bb isoform X1 n=1 Tax=Dunckerocampus dactyliophorus TaxID=161453 RepID=UPI002406B537|nr:integral membrane protein 2Bb isoform X1 [Dunckerocampus dactyliophorus]
MVKVSFNSAFSQKDVKKDAETLIAEEDKDAEAALPLRHQSRAWCWCMCLGVGLMLSGMVVGGAYLYRYYILEVSVSPQSERVPSGSTLTLCFLFLQEGEVFVCGVNYLEEDLTITELDQVEVALPMPLRQLEERIRVLEEEQVELISVPVPEFEDGDPADIVHDFQRRLTAYLDLSLNKCYVIPLNTSIVMPPRDFQELLVNIKAGTYLPQSYLVQEEMVVTERLEHVEQLGQFIHNLCHGKDTFKLHRRDRILGMQKRQVLNCRKIRHFENKFVVETQICEL